MRTSSPTWAAAAHTSNFDLSLQASPNSVSLPPLPSIRSLPSRPQIVFASALPWIELSPFVAPNGRGPTGSPGPGPGSSGVPPPPVSGGDGTVTWCVMSARVPAQDAVVPVYACAEQPSPSVTLSTTSKVPAVVYVCVVCGPASSALVPSPKFQS